MIISREKNMTKVKETAEDLANGKVLKAREKWASALRAELAAKAHNRAMETEWETAVAALRALQTAAPGVAWKAASDAADAAWTLVESLATAHRDAYVDAIRASAAFKRQPRG